MRARISSAKAQTDAALAGYEGAELLLSQSRTDSATSLVAVYKALGAGWTTTSPP